MDLLLPQAEKNDQRTTPRITFRSFQLTKAHAPKAVNLQRSGFYYIGRNTSHIEKLVAVYKRGYASEGLDNVKAELLRSLQQEKNMLPEVILCEARFDFVAIQDFSQFLRQHPVLNSIPFILDGSGLSGEELLLYKKNTRPDEILFLQDCDEKSLKLKIQFLRKVKTGGSHNATAPRIEESLKRDLNIGRFFKRAFDVLIAAIALLLLSPLFLLIALAIRIESRGSIFYIAKRAGKGYKIFNFYKFRTMQVGSDKKMSELTHLNQYSGEAKGPIFFKINNDPRITKVGTFLRNTSLDELPQLVNVFLGDMSLVGNRPLPLYEAQTLTTDDYAARFMAPAGITGLWQIKKRGNKDMSVEERINIDIAYASSCNFATDLWIIANTPSALLQKENV
jgi:lipopolysaccharide/colanic/teichoic acid biosynthesis glycosyltransferase